LPHLRDGIFAPRSAGRGGSFFVESTAAFDCSPERHEKWALFFQGRLAFRAALRAGLAHCGVISLAGANKPPPAEAAWQSLILEPLFVLGCCLRGLSWFFFVCSGNRRKFCVIAL
jgi:hypothetical protein